MPMTSGVGRESSKREQGAANRVDSFARERVRPSDGKLPSVLSSFVGRERELAEIERLLSGDVRLLTLTGLEGGGQDQAGAGDRL